MPDIVMIGASIEGDAVAGHSRDPILARGRTLLNGIKCFKFIAKFDVKASITKLLPPETAPLLTDSIRTSGNELSCENAVIHSCKAKISYSLGTNISGTHSANVWSYPNQTNVRIERSHQEIENALKKKKLLPKPMSDSPEGLAI